VNRWSIVLQTMLMLERPSPDEVAKAAMALVARHQTSVLATARRYAATPEDAEDAYQRSLEILLTKAPTAREEELLPWLRTVVKHEAFALRRQRDRLTPVSGDGEPVERLTHAAATHEQAERYERLRQGAEALRRLKPQEIRCLVLRARGLSYREICDQTGWTYTKVNRCLTEGRQALTRQLAGIEGGLECDRLAPLLSALADGEATAEQLALLLPHMKTCLACRARLREFRAAPARVAAVAPLAVVVHSLAHAAHGKAVALAERAHAAAELITGHKVAAVAASAAALAGGGTAVDQLANHHGPPVRPPAQRAVTPPRESPPAAGPSPSLPQLTAEQQATKGLMSSAGPSSFGSPSSSDPAREFAPSPIGAAAAVPAAEAATAASAGPAASDLAASGHTASESASPELRTAARPARTPPSSQAAPAPASAGEFSP
jgi:RNA polymerase sigma factor (sigma-70 family)